MLKSGATVVSERLPVPAAKAGEISTAQHQREEEAYERYLRLQLAPSTARAYRADWRIFSAWCDERTLVSMPASADTVARFLAVEADGGRSVSTLEKRLAAIKLAHEVAEQPVPTGDKAVRAVLMGIKRDQGSRRKQKAPALVETLRALLAEIPDSLRGQRDRALLLVTFAGAFRRSEVVGITVEDIEFVLEGMKITLPRSKTDQAGLGAVVPIVRGQLHCPIRALRHWLDHSGITTGPVFVRVNKAERVQPGKSLTGQTVALLVKWYGFKAGLDIDNLAAHSLRRGWLTQAAINGKSPFKMRAVSRQTLQTLQGYVDDAEAFEDHAGAEML